MTEDLLVRVTGKRPVTPSIDELELRPAGGRLDFRPGQYVLMSDVGGEVPPRSYSIANAPRRDGSIELFVTRVQGGRTSTWVHDELAPGETVCISGPYGTFTQQLPLDRPVLHLAAGSGLAPVLALTEAALRHRTKSRIVLLFSARTSGDVYKRDRIARWQARYANFEFVRTLTRESGARPLGRIPALLPSLFSDLSGFAIFIAGSGGFVDACEQAVIELGAPRARVHTEPFFSEPHPWTSAPPARSALA